MAILAPLSQANPVMRSNLSISAAESRLDPIERKKVEKAARDFEAVFVRQLISSMRKASEGTGDDEQGEAEKMSMDLAWDGLADKIADAGGLGVARMMEPWLAGEPSRIQGIERTLPDPLPMVAPATAAAPASQASRSYAQASGKLDAKVLDALADKASRATGVDASLIRGVIQAESAGNARARSSAGAVGLMQLMPGTARELGVNPLDAEQNVMGGARYLAGLLKRFGGDERLALAGYNAGPGAVEKYGGIPPYAETRNYVNTVLTHRRRYAGGDS